MSGSAPARDDEFAVASEQLSDAAAQIILISGLTAYNEAQVGPDPVRDPSNHVCIVARDREGRVRGGAQGVAVGAWLALDTVWVEDAFRRRGLGGRVLEAAEAEGRRRGCKWAILATFEYQAPDFYSRRGYVEYARMEDFPWGHTRYQLRKGLACEGEESND